MRKKKEILRMLLVSEIAAVCITAAVAGRTITVWAAEQGLSESQSTISTTVPDSHNIRVEREHANVVFEEEESRDEEGISDNFTVDRFSEPKIQITPEKGWKIKRILLNDQDVTEQLKDGVLTLSPVYEDQQLVIETEEGEPAENPDDNKDPENPTDGGKDQSKGNGTGNTGGLKDTETKSPKKNTSNNRKKQWKEIKAAVTGDEALPKLLIISVIVSSGLLVGMLVREKKEE